MKNKFNWVVALYLLSFCLPVLEGFEYQSQVLMGWDIALEALIYSKDSIFSGDDWQILYYLIALIPNVFIFLVILLKYSKKSLPLLIWTLSLIAVILALFWTAFFFNILFDYFSFGYWTWLIAIILIHYYSNNGTFKRPQ
jgi:hypothetical protein